MNIKSLLLFYLAFILMFQSCSDSDDTVNNSWSCGDSITDIDGNVYNTTNIDGQCWTVQNLKVSNYNDATPILNITDQTEWSDASVGAWSYYDNDAAIGNVHGKLYNWYTIETGKLCPEGWHIPSISDWNALVNSLGGSATAGIAMKSISNWNNSPENATNSSGLNVLPSGNRDVFGGFLGLGDNVWFYTSTQSETDNTKANWLKVTSGTDTSSGLSNKKDGLPCRCILD